MNEYHYKDMVVTIEIDEYAPSPREWDNLTKMCFFHKRYDLGDIKLQKKDFESWDEVKEYLKKEYKAKMIKKVYFYEHGSIGISLDNSHYPFNCRWDSGTLGFVFIDKETWEREKLTEEKAERIIRREIEDYDHWLSGEVYLVIVSKKKVCKCCGKVSYEIIDSCSGIYSVEEAIDWCKKNVKDWNKFKEVEE